MASIHYSIKAQSNKDTRNKFIDMMATAGVECSVHYKPIFDFSYYQQVGINRSDYPNTVEAGEVVVSLPIYPTLKLSDVDYICMLVEEIVSKNS